LIFSKNLTEGSWILKVSNEYKIVFEKLLIDSVFGDFFNLKYDIFSSLLSSQIEATVFWAATTESSKRNYVLRDVPSHFYGMLQWTFFLLSAQIKRILRTINPWSQNEKPKRIRWKQRQIYPTSEATPRKFCNKLKIKS